uniref:Laminin subunit beta 3 n=1 Tax=Esox lucius TaxID=8010 RepID=A0A3P8XNR7_ESOLU
MNLLFSNDCYFGACYPPIEDLLLGRGQQLHASSTCGLTGSEVFCSPLGLSKMKCCPCDSRNPSSYLAHTIQDVLSSARPNRWWQARKDVNPVTIQLDLENPFQLDTLLLTFKGPRPNALVVERTVDNGKTWKPAIYMASDCRSAFPGVGVTTPRSLDETYCLTMPPPPANPYQDHMVSGGIKFQPLLQYSTISVPNGEKIQEVSGLTGLRVKLTELGVVPHLPGRSPSRFYAVKEMRVLGTCLCHGHANRCLPDTSSNLLSRTLVSAQCECQHNTAGVNCERCADLYNNLPWRPAEEGNPHTCQRCECNNHALRCRFDLAVYEASGRRSGGVCEGCLHHTTGPKCDRCAPGYQPNPRSSMDRPDACIRCSCSAEGAENEGQCDDITGSCRCKANVEGPSCDRCKTGYYGLSASNPLGCTKCSCSVEGSTTSACDAVTGQCRCRPQFQGQACDICAHGYWNPTSSRGCEPCRCDPTNSLGDACDQSTGQCKCKSGIGGRTCAGCPDNTYGNPVTGCRRCQCDAEGTVSGGCDKRTGACKCRPGITGPRCDACSRGYCDSFPNCEVCPSCFTDLDVNIQNLNLVLESLSKRVPSLPGGTLPSSLVPRIRALEASLNRIKGSLPLPPPSTRLVDNALTQFTNICPLHHCLCMAVNTAFCLCTWLVLSKGNFSAIKNAYDKSTDAAKKVSASENTVEQSTAVRKVATDLQNKIQSANTIDLEKLNQQLNTKPDLTPTAKQVCGSTRWDRCTPANCEGDLCPPEAQPCGRREHCVGALPLGTLAVTDAEEVKDRLQQLNDTIKQATSQVEAPRRPDLKPKRNASILQVASAVICCSMAPFCIQLTDRGNARDNPTLINNISEEVLRAKLPDNLPALKRKLQKIRDLLAGLPNTSAILGRTGPQLDTALRLLQEAKDARYNCQPYDGAAYCSSSSTVDIISDQSWAV